MTRETGIRRSYEESCTLLDRIVGRCVRDRQFAECVLADPERALAEYDLTADELDDFHELCIGHREEADEVWTSIRARLAKQRPP